MRDVLSGRRDSPRATVPPSARPWVDEVTETWLTRIRDLGVDVVGDLADLRTVWPDDHDGWPDPDAADPALVADLAIDALVHVLDQLEAPARGAHAGRDRHRGPAGTAAPRMTDPMTSDYAEAVGGWRAHLRDGGTTTWAQWRARAAQPRPPGWRDAAAPAHPCPTRCTSSWCVGSTSEPGRLSPGSPTSSSRRRRRDGAGSTYRSRGPARPAPVRQPGHRPELPAGRRAGPPARSACSPGCCPALPAPQRHAGPGPLAGPVATTLPAPRHSGQRRGGALRPARAGNGGDRLASGAPRPGGARSTR